MLLAQLDLEKSFFGKTGTTLSKTENIGSVVSAIISNAIVVAGVILLFFLISGGIGLISAAGNNNPEAAEKGKKTVTTALIGFVVVFAAYWIVQLIGKLTGIDILGY